MGSITGLVAAPHCQDDLVVAIDLCLAVVALNPAVFGFEDVTVWIRVGGAFRAAVIALGLAFWIAGGRGGEVAAGHRHRINAAQRIRR
jgi:hypothetical protein